jgi:hypothetical protein
VQEDCSGWDSPDGCVTFASRWPSFPKTAYINKIQYWILFVAETSIFVVLFNSLW